MSEVSEVSGASVKTDERTDEGLEVLRHAFLLTQLPQGTMTRGDLLAVGLMVEIVESLVPASTTLGQRRRQASEIYQVLQAEALF